MKENGVHQRDKPRNGNAISNGVHHEQKDESQKKKYEEFAIRESPLTILLDSSLHIRAIYHIFIVILIMLFFDTVVYDFIESGKINIGLSVVIHGFGDVKRGLKLWSFDLAVALAFYPGLILFSLLGKLARKYKVLRPAIIALGVAVLIATEAVLIAVPSRALNEQQLEVGSAIAVTLEIFRYMMKIMAVATALGPRCLSGELPLPTFKHYLYFLFAPTLLYRDQYPRTKKTRWGVVMYHLLEVGAVIFYVSFLWERFLVRSWSEYGKQKTVSAGEVVRGIFVCVLPGIIAYLSGFYCLLHAWLNMWSEMLTFGDRLFYENWWTSGSYSEFFRSWNRVVYCWLRDHIYKPAVPYTGRPVAAILVILLSCVAHEVALALSFGFFYPLLFVMFGIAGALMVPLTAGFGKRHPNLNNLLLWVSLFVGNGMLWSFYPMEYFARKNCPPSENDSYFIPKSWSCPEITIDPNWKFQNPFRL